MSHVLEDLAGLLDRLGPNQTPAGQVRWRREFPMAGDALGFCASVDSAPGRLQAQVVQEEAGQQKQIFQAAWVARQGGWVFQEARLDGRRLGEAKALAAFADYVRALGVEPQSAPPDAALPRRTGLG